MQALRTLEAREGERLFVPGATLNDEDAIELRETGIFEVEFPSPLNNRSYVLRSPRTVGLIPVTRDLMVRVVPKIPTANVFGMLELVYDLPSLRFYDGVVSIDTIEDVYSSLAELLARGVLRRSRRGLFADYVVVNEGLGTVRGKIDLGSTLRLRSQGHAEIQCSYSVHTVDIADNQILLAALDRIPRLGKAAGRVVDSVRLARRALLGSVQLKEHHGRECIGRSYNRLNYDYRPLHALSRFFLESMGPGLDVGRHEFLPFRVDMAFLFQEYLAQSLRQAFNDVFVVDSQYRVNLGGELGFALVMDIVLSDLRSGTPIAVVDAKYKAEARPTPDDTYQVVAYAARLNVRHAILIYPIATGSPRSGSFGSVRVTALGYDIGGSLSGSRRKLSEEILTLLKSGS